MKPSDFRKRHPELRDGELALAYAMYKGVDLDSARAAFERWDKVLMGETKPLFVGVDVASGQTK